MAHFLCHLGCSHFGALLLDFYFTENKYTGGFADLKDSIVCGIVGLICIVFIVKRTIDFLKNKKS